MFRRLLVLVVGLALAVGAACVTAPAAGHSGTQIAPGVVVYGVPLGGFSSEPARRLLRDAMSRPLPVEADDVQRRVVPETFGLAGAVDEAVAEALAASGPRQLGARATVDRKRIARYVRRLDVQLRRPARDAALAGVVDLRPQFVSGQPGRRIDRKQLAAGIERALVEGRRDPVAVRFVRVEPKLRIRDLGPIVVIGRYSNRLFLYEGRDLVAAFPVATGEARYPTPIGTFRIVDMQRHPWWYPPPTSEWARGLEPVPPGPGNPLGTRWMGLDVYGVGIHGTPNAASLGYSASHGCIRMAIPSAEWLFERVNVGTPVVIAPA